MSVISAAPSSAKGTSNRNAATTAGGSKFGSITLDPGKKQRKTVNLRAGSYIAVCTVFNGAHAAAGMFVNFTVGTQSGEDGSWS